MLEFAHGAALNDSATAHRCREIRLKITGLIMFLHSWQVFFYIQIAKLYNFAFLRGIFLLNMTRLLSLRRCGGHFFCESVSKQCTWQTGVSNLLLSISRTGACKTKPGILCFVEISKCLFEIRTRQLEKLWQNVTFVCPWISHIHETRNIFFTFLCVCL